MRSHRVDSIDLLRGLVMVLMVLDHTRDFMGWLQPPERMEDPGAPLFLTRWVTHFCAPVFIFLAGAGAFFYGVNRQSRSRLARFLVTRGLWLIMLEVTVIFSAWTFTWPLVWPMLLQVIWVLGVSMIVLAGLIWLPRAVILLISLPVIALHDILSRSELDQSLVESGFNSFPSGAWERIYSLLHVAGKMFPLFEGGPFVFIVYPLIPWIAVMAVGYAVAPVFQDPANRVRHCLWIGFSLTATFVLTRVLWPGIDLNFPFDGESWISFLNTNKYPPSLPFLLMTIGPAFLLIALFETTRGVLVDWMLVFGRVPLFFYVIHAYLAHVVCLFWLKARCGVWLTNVFQIPAELGPDNQPTLAEIYIAWVIVVALLYPACRWFMDLKRRRRDLWWLSYL